MFLFLLACTTKSTDSSANNSTDSALPDSPVECADLSIDECEASDCNLVSGRPASESADGSTCIDWNTNPQPAGCTSYTSDLTVMISPSTNVKPTIAIFYRVDRRLKTLMVPPVSTGASIRSRLDALLKIAVRLWLVLPRLQTVCAGFFHLEPFLPDGLNVHTSMSVSKIL